MDIIDQGFPCNHPGSWIVRANRHYAYQMKYMEKTRVWFKIDIKNIVAIRWII